MSHRRNDAYCICDKSDRCTIEYNDDGSISEVRTINSYERELLFNIGARVIIRCNKGCSVGTIMGFSEPNHPDHSFSVNFLKDGSKAGSVRHRWNSIQLIDALTSEQNVTESTGAAGSPIIYLKFEEMEHVNEWISEMEELTLTEFHLHNQHLNEAGNSFTFFDGTCGENLRYFIYECSRAGVKENYVMAKTAVECRKSRSSKCKCPSRISGS